MKGSRYDFDIPLGYAALIVTYADGRMPWPFILPVENSYPKKALFISPTRICIVGAKGVLCVVDVELQAALSIARYPAHWDARTVYDHSRQRMYLFDQTESGMVVVDLDPLHATVYDQLQEPSLLSDRYARLRLAPGGLRPDGNLTVFGGLEVSGGKTERKAYVLDTSTNALHALCVIDKVFDRMHFNEFSPSGRLIAGCYTGTVASAHGRVPESAADPLVELSPLHPDLVDDGNQRWGTFVGVWEVAPWRPERIIVGRYYTERELHSGWVLDYPAGTGDVMWQFADWFGIAGSRTPQVLERYQKSRKNEEIAHAAAVDALTEFARTRRVTDMPFDFSSREDQAKACGRRNFLSVVGVISQLSWEADETGFWILYTDGAVRKIWRDGRVGKLTWIERFRRETWQWIGPARRQDVDRLRGTVSRMEMRNDGAMRFYDSANLGGRTKWLHLDPLGGGSVSRDVDGYIPEPYSSLNDQIAQLWKEHEASFLAPQ